MPSQFDTTQNNLFRKPVFDDASDKTLYDASKEADEVFELRPPPVPTPEMEVEYIDWLQEDFKSDPWVTYRFRKYTANPKRIPWKNTRQLKRQHQFTFLTHWALGSALAWPVAAAFGRLMKTSRGGVPAVHLNRHVHDIPRPDPGRIARITFRWYSVGASIALGYVFAKYVTDSSYINSNRWYNRPDLKPFAAMVEKPPNNLTEETMIASQYVQPRHQLNAKTAQEGSGLKASPIYRFFFHRDADWTIKQNPYATQHHEDVWDQRKGHYATYSNRFGEHHQ